MSPSSSAVARRPPDLGDASPCSVSRLAVRNRTINVAVSTRSNASGVDEQSLPSQEQPSLRESRSNHSQAYQPAGHSASKKKGSWVLGFLKLKEPSTSALDVFAVQERKRAAQKHSRGDVPGTSSQKLPDHVPKVNSKWNGLPEPSKAKHRKNNGRGDKEILPGSRDSVSSYGSTTGRPHSRRRTKTDSTGAESCSVSSSSRTATELAVQGTRNHELMTSSSRSPLSPVAPPPEGRPDSHSDIALPMLESSGCSVTSPEASPRTPALEEGESLIQSRRIGSQTVTTSHEPFLKPHGDGCFVVDDSNDTGIQPKRFNASSFGRLLAKGGVT